MLKAVGVLHQRQLANLEATKAAETTAMLFLGVRVACAKCHNHPFDRWTQEDYYGLSAFFARVKTRMADNKRRASVSVEVVSSPPRTSSVGIVRLDGSNSGRPLKMLNKSTSAPAGQRNAGTPFDRVPGSSPLNASNRVSGKPSSR